MSTRRALLAGRNNHPLTQEEIRRAINIVMGMEEDISVRYDPTVRTAFTVAHDEITGEEYGEIVLGPDVFPGRSLVDANSALSVEATAAHELTHYCRWKNKAQFNEVHLEHLDEALTSLEAALRYEKHLKQHDLRQLIQDAIQRLYLLAHEGTD